MEPITSGLTFDLPNYVGEVFYLTPNDTPFLSMIGGLTGGRGAESKDLVWSTVDNAAAAQPAILEGDDPVMAQRARSEVTNVAQIFQYGWQASYSKLATPGQLGSGGASPALPATSIIGQNYVPNELTFQQRLKIERAARDMDYTFLRGVYANPNDNSAARKTRGIITAITTNAVAAGSAALTTTHVDTLLKTMFDNGAPFRNPVVFVNSFQKQKFTGLYGYAPESRTVGGLNIKQIETDFAVLGIVVDRQMPTDTVLVADLSVCVPRFLTVEGKGHFFVEPVAQTGAAVKYQLYGEAGLEYGPEPWHGKITGLATS